MTMKNNHCSDDDVFNAILLLKDLVADLAKGQSADLRTLASLSDLLELMAGKRMENWQFDPADIKPRTMQ